MRELHRKNAWRHFIVAARQFTILALATWGLIRFENPLVWIPLAFLAANLAIVMAAGVKYDAWSCFQSRLLFPSFATIALGYAWGIEASRRKWPATTRFVDMTSVALCAAFLTYFGIEITHVVVTTLG